MPFKPPPMAPAPKLPNTVLGVDMGYDSLKLALCHGSTVRKVASAPMPRNLIREGRVTSIETMGELIRQTVRQNGMRRVRHAAVPLSNELSYVRDVTMPLMSAEQLIINIPYEFNDYITDGPHGYAFDYAMISTPEDLEREWNRAASEEKDSPSMNLMLSAVQTSVLDDTRRVLRKAGLKLVKAAPSVCAYISLLRHAARTRGAEDRKESCILDLGFQSIRMYMFRGDRHIATRVLEGGLSALDRVIADELDLDARLAHTYLLTNYGGCQTRKGCLNAYHHIAVELMRALNFYRFRNPDSAVNDVWLCGGGTAIAPLRDVIRETLDMKIHQAASLAPGGEKIPDCYYYTEAIGIAME